MRQRTVLRQPLAHHAVFGEKHMPHTIRTHLQTILALAGLAVATQAAAQVTFYEEENFRGQSFSSTGQVRNFARDGFNDRASSVEVATKRWEMCENSRFTGRCVVLRAGRYPSLAAMGLNDRVSSARMLADSVRVPEDRYAPAPPPVAADYRRRHNERLYQADVLTVRAVVGPPQQRCWIEQEPVQEEGSNKNMPAAIAGALIGGILGHQVGGGTGQDLATVGGAVAGAAIGANSGRNRTPAPAATRNVQRCESVPNQTHPDFWDVTYTFRGQAHQVQMSTPPGQTVTVNERGEPRL